MGFSKCLSGGTEGLCRFHKCHPLYSLEKGGVNAQFDHIIKRAYVMQICILDMNEYELIYNIMSERSGRYGNLCQCINMIASSLGHKVCVIDECIALESSQSVRYR